MENRNSPPHTPYYHGPFSCVDTPRVEATSRPIGPPPEYYSELARLENEYRAKYKSAAEWGGRGIF